MSGLVEQIGEQISALPEGRYLTAKELLHLGNGTIFAVKTWLRLAASASRSPICSKPGSMVMARTRE
jgi:hypothetical protein